MRHCEKHVQLGYQHVQVLPQRPWRLLLFLPQEWRLHCRWSPREGAAALPLHVSSRDRQAFGRVFGFNSYWICTPKHDCHTWTRVNHPNVGESR